MLHDIRYALRSLVRTPAFAATAIVTLALGIGANTATFSLIDAVLLRTLPVQAPEHLFFVGHGVPGIISTSASYVWLERVRQRDDAFEGVTAYDLRRFKVASEGGLEQVSGQYVSGNYHALVGVPFALGRGFASENDRMPGSSPVAVISDDYWSRRFGRRADVLGATIVVGGHPVSIVGVTAPGFQGLQPGQSIDITLPLSIRVQNEPEFLTEFGWLSIALVARLKDGVTAAQGGAAVEAAFRGLVSQPPYDRAARTRDGRLRSAVLVPAGQGADALRTRYERSLRVLMAMVAVVLLVSCINVANLLLVRASARTREVAVRMSVGASRWRIARQLLTENMVLAVAGGALGLLVAGWGTRFVSSLLAEGENPTLVDAQLNTTVLLFTGGVSLLTGLIFGLAPAVRGTRVELTPALKQMTPSARRGPRSSGQKVLLAAQLALCLVLVFGSGLLVRTLRNLQNIEGGFARDNVLLFSIDANDTAFPHERLPDLCSNVLDRLRSRSDVRSASCSTMTPVHGQSEMRGLAVPELPDDPDARSIFVAVVSPDHFDTFGIPVVRGRTFTPLDTATSQRVAVVNEAMARFYFGTGDAIGRTIAFRGVAPDPISIVGVVRDARQQLREPPPRMVFTPLPQIHEPTPYVTAAVRTLGSPASLAASVRSEVAEVSRDVAVTYVRTMNEQIDAAMIRERLMATLSAAFGVLTLILSCVGLYGVTSYNVMRSTHDIGIRLALGARRGAVLFRVLSQVSVIALAGIAAGLLGSVLVSRAVSQMLFGVPATDPATLGAAVVALLTTALLAGYFPARRAAQVDPAVTLRAE